MKKLLLSLIFLFPVLAFAQAQIISSGGHILCDNPIILSVDPDDSNTFEWTVNNNVIPGNTGNSLFVTSAGSYTVNVTTPLGEEFSDTFRVYEAGEAIFVNGGTICVDFTTDAVLSIQDLVSSIYSDLGDYTFSWYKDGVIIIGASSNMYYAYEEGTYQIVAEDVISGCSIYGSAEVIKSGPASVIGNGYTINGQTISLSIQGFGEYEYQLDNGPYQQSLVFTDVSYGSHVISIMDVNGCSIMVISFNITMPDEPAGESTQTFTDGQTLADLDVEGENIQWYDTPGDAPPSDMDADTPLPLNTLLVDNTTYYASQTIDGVESAERLAVTAVLVLSTNSNALKGLSYYPNPVKNILNVSNATAIDEVIIYNTLGQEVLNQQPAGRDVNINMSLLGEGIYMVKITSGKAQKTIKVIKQ